MLLALLFSLPAHAIELKWWGVGPTIGTMAVPPSYPLSLPANAKDENDEPLVSKVKGDFLLGARAVAYPTASGRLAARAGTGFGTNGWSRWELVAGYDHALIKEGDFQLLLGGAIGAGTEKYPSKAETDEAFLRANYFPLRVELTALLRDRTRAYEAGIFGAYHIVGDQAWYDAPGDTDPTSGAEAADGILGSEGGVAGALYASIGVEARAYFGDFKSRGGGKGGSGKRRGRR